MDLYIDDMQLLHKIADAYNSRLSPEELLLRVGTQPFVDASQGTDIAIWYPYYYDNEFYHGDDMAKLKDARRILCWTRPIQVLDENLEIADKKLIVGVIWDEGGNMSIIHLVHIYNL